MEGGMRWVEPDDAKKAEGRNGSRGAGSGMSFPTSFGPAQSTLETTAETVANAGARAAGVKSAKPVYTVPTNSTLMGAVALPALRSEARRVGKGCVSRCGSGWERYH